MYDLKYKAAFFLPNSFTALNLACGFGAILYAVENNYYYACLLLILGALFDSVDGRIARLMGTSSSFGEQFDSICDVVTFGAAPAFVFYMRFFQDSGRAGIVLAFLFLLCGALRLARFNSNIDKVSSDFFQGLPIPGAAFALVGYILLSILWRELISYTVVAMIYIGTYSLLMISNIPFCSFKKSNWVKKHIKRVFLIMVLIFAAIFIYEQIMIFLFITLYVLGSLIYFFARGGRIVDIFMWKEEKENEEK